MLPSKLFYDRFFDEMPVMKGMQCDIYEKDNKYHIELDVPGYKKDEIKIECHKGTITIKAEKNEETNIEEDGKKYIRRERKYGSFERSFHLGDIDEDGIEAKYSDGILKITIPEKKEIETKQIEIN